MKLNFEMQVRQNLVKHLKLHLRLEKRAKEAVEGDKHVAVPPPITPINPPVDTTKVRFRSERF